MLRKVRSKMVDTILEENKYEDLFDFSSLECRTAAGASICLSLGALLASFFIGSNELANHFCDDIFNLSIAIIGLLGVIVSALALLVGLISSKVVSVLKSHKKEKNIERILLSFYLLGLTCAVYIFFSISLKLIIWLPINATVIGNTIIALGLSYFFVFIILYTVKLIGNCLELFTIINELTCDKEQEVDYKEKYNSYRINALEKQLLSQGTMEQLNDYKRTINEQIENDTCAETDKDILRKYSRTHFGEEK